MSIKPISPLPRDPRSRAEWQAAADGAHTLLQVDACKQYGLITGGPTINVERCELILTGARIIRGIKPKFSHKLLEELCI